MYGGREERKRADSIRVRSRNVPPPPSRACCSCFYFITSINPLSEKTQENFRVFFPLFALSPPFFLLYINRYRFFARGSNEKSLFFSSDITAFLLSFSTELLLNVSLLSISSFIPFFYFFSFFSIKTNINAQTDER